MKEFVRRDIIFTFIKTNDKCDDMIDDMKKAFKPSKMGLIDLFEPPQLGESSMDSLNNIESG